MKKTIKTIVCTGDSHTWGQGPAGISEYFINSSNGGYSVFGGRGVCAGDLRPVPFEFPCYVNLIRNEINKLTGSFATEREYKICIDSSYKIDCSCKLVRLFFKCGPSPALCKINDRAFWLPASRNDNSYKTAVLFLRENENIEIKTDSKVYLYRGEFYGGEYAVINSGVGSCTSERYITDYYNDYVTVFKPSIIVEEAHSINDWLNKIPTENVNRALKYIAQHHMQEDCIPIMLTVAPIKGETALPFNSTDYSVYVEESRRAAMEAGIIIADANQAISAVCKTKNWYSDNWHVNEEGHKVYAKTVMDVINEFELLHDDETVTQ